MTAGGEGLGALRRMRLAAWRLAAGRRASSAPLGPHSGFIRGYHYERQLPALIPGADGA